MSAEAMPSAVSPPNQPAAATPQADDLFALGRAAAALRDQTFGRRGTFARARQLLATGAWRGPRDAAEATVDEADLAALGGWPVARQAGVTTLLGGRDVDLMRAAGDDGARLMWRVPFRLGEGDGARVERLRAVARLAQPGRSRPGPSQPGLARLWTMGLCPTPEGEPYGLDTLRFVALCRLHAPAGAHVVADLTALGPRLAQMALGFGADELLAPIVAERALRLGDNAGNPALTRKEAVTLIRGAGLTAAERLAGGVLEEVA